MRKERLQLVREPMIALLNDIADADPYYDDFFVWGLGKMVWPWQRQVGVIRLAPGHEHSLSFDLDGLEVRGNWWPPNLAKFRTSVAAEGSGAEFERALNALHRKGFEIDGNLFRRVPRGYPADHERADLLRYRTLSAYRHLGCDDWLHSSGAVDRVLAALAQLRPLARWFATHVPSV